MKAKPLILIVDDDKGICKLIENKLEAEGFSVESAYSGTSAIEKCLETDNILLLLDYRLPDMTGEQVIKNLGSNGHSIPFVIITGQGDEKVAVEMMKLGARDYITKDATFLDIVTPIVHRVVGQLEMERKLAESEERLKFTQFAVERFSDAAYWMGSDARFVYVNKAACQNLGYTKEELLNMTVHDIAPEFPKEVWPDHWKDLKKRRSFIIQTTHRKKNGEIFPVEISINYVEFEGKEYNCVFARDITDRVKIQDALEESEANARAFMDAFPNPAFIADNEQSIIISNRMCIDIGAMPGSKCYETLFGVGERCSWCRASDALSRGEHLQEIVELEDSILEVNWVPISNDRYLYFSFDISEKRKSEEEKQILEEQIQHSQKLESLGVLAGGIAHDFNNLLVGILGNAGLAAMKMDPETPGMDSILKIETAAQRAAELTNQMLAFSGKGKFIVEPINLNKLVEEMGHLLQAATAKNAVIRYNLEKELPSIEADSSQIRQVVMNLITNASDAVEGTSGVVTITSGSRECDRKFLAETLFGQDLAEGAYVFLEVSDTGHGMDKEVLDKIFDPFFTTKPMGRGLGMAAVLGIVKGHSGTIMLSSKPGSGTTFKIFFPASDKPYAEKTGMPADLEGWRGDGTILVVDDEESVLDIAESILTDLGFTVLTAPDGREGLKMFKEKVDEIDLVILDMTMPHMGGVETFREMSRAKKDVKVILSSGFSEEDATAEFNDKGLMGFIQKPYLPAALINIVREALDG